MKPVIPDEVLRQHLIALGKTGSGKSSTLRVLVERLFELGKFPCIIDPKGDWWGLKSSADGRKAGYPLVIFGGEHADVPLNAHAGAHVAELVATGNRACVIDLGGWTVSDRTRFFVDFAQSLFRNMRGARWLVIDEVHNFAPQGKVMDPDAGKMLHWANRLASEGRGKGLNILAASQRPQKVHKDFVTSCETLVAMRVIHPLDRRAIADWIDGCPDAEKGKEVLSTLASMQRGEAWIWSPEIGFGPVRVRVPKFKTYDSFKPQEEHVARLPGWADVDLDEVRAKLEAVVKDAQANDPRALRAEVSRLKAELARKSHVAAPTPAKEVLVAEYARGLADGAEDARAQTSAAAQKAADAISSIAADLARRSTELATIHFGLLEPVQGRQQGARAPRATLSAPVPRPRETIQRPADGHVSRETTGEIRGGGLRRMMTALAQRPQGLSTRQIAVRAGMSSNSGTFARYLSTMRSSGWVDGPPSGLRTTPAGLEALGQYDPLPTGRALLDHWLGELGDSGAARMLRVVAEAYPQAISNSEIAERAEMSDNSGTFARYLSTLRSLQLVEGRGSVRASEEFFQ